MDDPKKTLTDSVKRMLTYQEAIKKLAEELRREKEAKAGEKPPES